MKGNPLKFAFTIGLVFNTKMENVVLYEIVRNLKEVNFPL